MKVRYLVIVLMAALVVVGSVSKCWFGGHAVKACIVAEDDTSSDDSGGDSDYTEFA